MRLYYSYNYCSKNRAKIATCFAQIHELPDGKNVAHCILFSNTTHAMYSLACVSQTRTVKSKLVETSLCSDWPLHLTEVMLLLWPTSSPVFWNALSSPSIMNIPPVLNATANLDGFAGDHDSSDIYLLDNFSENISYMTEIKTLTNGQNRSKRIVFTVLSWLFKRILSVPSEKPTAT